jgi:hypothetical protein
METSLMNYWRQEDNISSCRCPFLGAGDGGMFEVTLDEVKRIKG